MKDRSDLVAVITGASRGLGAGMAVAFAENGVALGLCARTRPDVPSSRSGRSSLCASVDVTDATAVDGFAREVVGRFGRIDLWVNNAGVLDPIGPLADADPAALRHHVDINVTGVLHGSATFARHVRSRAEGGVLVNISSGAATTPYEGWAAYCASKAAVDMITEVVAREEAASGLRAYAVAPGMVDTDMQALIRSTPVAMFPSVPRFQQAHRQRAFNSAAWVARFILEQLVDRTERDWTEGERPQGAARSLHVRVPDESPSHQPRPDQSSGR